MPEITEENPLMTSQKTTESPQDAAAAARGRQDVHGEAQARLDADRALRTAEWYPPIAGDIITIHFERNATMEAFTECYLVTEIHDGTPRKNELVFTGCAPDTAEIRDMCGFFAGPEYADPVSDVWQEAGPERLTIERCGQIIHDGPGSAR